MWKNVRLAVGLVSVVFAIPVAAGEEPAAGAGSAAVSPSPEGSAGPAPGYGGCRMGHGWRGGAGPGDAERSAGPRGCCNRCGGGSGAMQDDDHQVFFFLLDNRDRIRRDVRTTDKGIETVTESDDPELAAKIREHVAAMYARIEEGRPIHRRDPLFAEIFRHADKIRMEMEPTELGIRVRETSDDPEVVRLIQAHAEAVSLFLENGYPELHRDHPVQ